MVENTMKNEGAQKIENICILCDVHFSLGEKQFLDTRCVKQHAFLVDQLHDFYGFSNAQEISIPRTSQRCPFRPTRVPKRCPFRVLREKQGLWLAGHPVHGVKDGRWAVTLVAPKFWGWGVAPIALAPQSHIACAVVLRFCSLLCPQGQSTGKKVALATCSAQFLCGDQKFTQIQHQFGTT